MNSFDVRVFTIRHRPGRNTSEVRRWHPKVGVQFPAALLPLVRHSERRAASEMDLRVGTARLPRLSVGQRRHRRMRHGHPHHLIRRDLITEVSGGSRPATTP
jgi:hypothetical protein